MWFVIWLERKDEIGLVHPVAGAPDAFGLHWIGRIPQAGRIHDDDRQPAEIATNLDEIAGRAWNGRNDRGIALAQSIEQRGFSGIGRP